MNEICFIDIILGIAGIVSVIGYLTSLHQFRKTKNGDQR